MRKLGALVAVESNHVKIQVLDSLNIHGNILSAPIHGNIELIKPEILNLQIEDAKKLKGHKLSMNTIRNSVPAFSLQLYSNPCLYWLARPAFTILAALILDSETVRISEGKLNLFSMRRKRTWKWAYVPRYSQILNWYHKHFFLQSLQTH